MTDQVIIDFPELSYDQYKVLLDIIDKITVKVWKSDERKTFPLKWNGTRICCPITIWFDLPDNIKLIGV